MSLQDKLDELKAEARSRTPVRLQAVIEKATETLISEGRVYHALKAGDEAPSFVLSDAGGQPVRSSDLLRKGPLVITFYRGSWCPYCTLDLQALQSVHADILASGASLVAISQQTRLQSRLTRRDNAINYPMLDDHGGAIADVFGIRSVLPDDLKAVFLELGIDLPAFNGEDSWTLPMPARFVVGRDGIIAYAEVNPDHTFRPEPTELLPTLKRLARFGSA